MAAPKTQKFNIPLAQLNETLRRYQAELHRDVSTNKAHVYFSRPMQKWIAVVRKGETAILSFHDECPCSKTLANLVPW